MTENYDEPMSADEIEAQRVADENVAKAKAKARALREFASWIEAHPEYSHEIRLPSIWLFCHDAEKFAAIAKALGGKRKKASSGSYFMVERAFGEGLALELNIDHGVICERRVVGTRHIEEKVVPEKVVPAHEEEVVEWVCPESVLALETE